ncbi:MAG: hypothetical protein HYY17_07810 [Planctomycetes bacterium]|nr:hypothetical protein [Planctomycetota bacterium]
MQEAPMRHIPAARDARRITIWIWVGASMAAATVGVIGAEFAIRSQSRAEAEQSRIREARRQEGWLAEERKREKERADEQFEREKQRTADWGEIEMARLLGGLQTFVERIRASRFHALCDRCGGRGAIRTLSGRDASICENCRGRGYLRRP